MASVGRRGVRVDVAPCDRFGPRPPGRLPGKGVGEELCIESSVDVGKAVVVPEGVEVTTVGPPRLVIESGRGIVRVWRLGSTPAKRNRLLYIPCPHNKELTVTSLVLAKALFLRKVR